MSNFKKVVAIASLLSFGLLVSCLPVQPTSPKVPTSYNGPIGTALFKIMLAPGDTLFSKIASSAKVFISSGTGDPMSTITKALTITDTSVQGTVTGIPAGSSRVFKVSVYDSLDSLQYYGVDTADVIRNTTVDIAVNVKRVTGSVDIEGNIIEAGTQKTTDTTFTNVTTSAPWENRTDQRSVRVGNVLLLVGGSDGASALYNDVWRTTDGVNWTLVGNAGFSYRIRFGMTVFNNKIWVLGGYDGSYKNDVWSSSDTGKTWVCTDSTGPFTPRYAPALGSVGGNLIMLGGDEGDNSFTDVWSSPDGITWTQITSSAPFGGRDGVGIMATFNNKLWLISGQSSQYADVWYTSDGVTWTEATQNTGFGGRGGFETVVFKNKIWLIGGSYSGSQQNDIWNSSDGITWNEISSNGGFPPRSGFSSGVINNKIYIMGGVGNSAIFSDVWYYQ